MKSMVIKPHLDPDRKLTVTIILTLILNLTLYRFILEGLLRHSADMPTLGVLAKTLVRRWARAVQVCGWVHTGVFVCGWV